MNYLSPNEFKKEVIAFAQGLACSVHAYPERELTVPLVLRDYIYNEGWHQHIPWLHTVGMAAYRAHRSKLIEVDLANKPITFNLALHNSLGA